jgi:hypothetical protein
MATLERIERYRDRRPSSLLSDDMVAWELDMAPDCAAEVPPEFKAELEWMAADDGIADARAVVAATSPAALYDFASSPHGGRWKPLPDHGHEPAIRPWGLFAHSIVGSAAGAWSYFANSTSLESTTIVHKSGFFWQCMSRREQADAQYRANGFEVGGTLVGGISHETEDNGDPNTDPWTPAQLDTLVWLLDEDLREFNLPRQVMPDWDAPGLGFHSMFGAPSQLTPAVGKTCPGTVRIRQWHEQVLPRILGTLQEDDMPFSDTDKQFLAGQVDRIHADFVTLLRGETHASTARILAAVEETNRLLGLLVELPPPEPPA